MGKGTCGIVLVLALAACPGASAQSGVTVDPGSPSGKEYAIPLEQARRDAGSTPPPQRVRPGEREAQLFGEGVGDAQAQQDPDAPARSGSSSGAAGPDGGTPAADDPRPGAIGSPPPTEPVRRAAATDGNGALAVGGIGIGVLAIGTIAGIALRRRAA